MDDVEELMKRCRAGTTSYDAANGLHADCYGALGKQAKEIERLRDGISCHRAAIRKQIDDGSLSGPGDEDRKLWDLLGPMTVLDDHPAAQAAFRALEGGEDE